MELKSIFEDLRTLGLVRTQNDFSVIYLGKSQRYFSFLLSSGRSAPVHVWLSLVQRIERIADAYQTTMPHKAQLLYGLAEQGRLHVGYVGTLTTPRRAIARGRSR